MDTHALFIVADLIRNNLSDAFGFQFMITNRSYCGKWVDPIFMTYHQQRIEIEIYVGDGDGDLVSVLVNDMNRFPFGRPTHSFDWDRRSFFMGEPDFPECVCIGIREMLEKQKK